MVMQVLRSGSVGDMTYTASHIVQLIVVDRPGSGVHKLLMQLGSLLGQLVEAPGGESWGTVPKTASE